MAISLFATNSDKDEWKNSPGIFVFCWALFPFLFFSFSQSKLPGYILPSVPPAFLLISRSVSRLFASSRLRSAIWLGVTGAALAAVAGVSARALTMNGRLYNVPDARVMTLEGLALGGGILVAALSVWKRHIQAFAAVVLLVVALVAFMIIGMLPAASAGLSTRNIAHESFLLNPTGNDVAVYGLDRDRSYGLNYYFGRELPEWTGNAPQPEWLFTSEGEGIKLLRPGDQIFRGSEAAALRVVLIHTSSSGKNSH